MDPADGPTSCKQMPLTMTDEYKRHADGESIKRKVRCSMRGDLMKRGRHVDPANTTAYSYEKKHHSHPVRTHRFPRSRTPTPTDPICLYDRGIQTLQAGIYQANDSCREQVDTSKHSDRTTPTKSLWHQASEQHIPRRTRPSSALAKIPTLGSRPLPIQHSSAGSTFASITIDDFLVLITTLAMLLAFRESLEQKYLAKTLFPPTPYLG